MAEGILSVLCCRIDMLFYAGKLFIVVAKAQKYILLDGVSVQEFGCRFINAKNTANV